MQSFCRTCFQEIINNMSTPCDLQNPKNIHYKHQLMFCSPEMDLRALPDAKLCKECIATLDISYKFKIKCQEMESKINKEQFNMPTCSMVKQEMSLDNIYSICRICRVDITDKDFIVITETFKRILMLCVPKMDLQTVLSVSMCKNCYTTLNINYTFKLKCLDVEQNIKDYLKVNDIVVCRDVYVWYNTFVKTEINNATDFTIKQEEVNFIDKEELMQCSMQKSHFDQDVAIKKYHLQKHHTNNKKLFKCIYCEYSTVRKFTLQNHILTHTGEKPFKCSFCEYSTVYKCNLISHNRTHTREKPFKCSLCNYSAAEKSRLISHNRVHTGEKPFNCSFCEYSAAYRFSLRLHIRTHTGEKPFKCSLCEWSTAHKSNLNSHIRRHTGKKPLKCSF